VPEHDAQVVAELRAQVLQHRERPQRRRAALGRGQLTAAQRAAAERYIAKLRDAKIYPSPIVTEVTALNAFHPAEDYHQDYLVHHPNQPYIVINDAPKLEELRRRFPDLYRAQG